MKYENIYPGRFLDRPNRFLANVVIHGQTEVCHVKNTGRCRELLLPGAEVYVQKADSPKRKTKYDLIGVKKGNVLVNMDSQITNGVVEEWIRRGNFKQDVALVRREVKYGNSRFDLYVEYEEDHIKRRAFLEVKGVTLEDDGIARFPDAPTDRGVRHLTELCQCVKEGYEAYVVFVIQMKGIRFMTPNWKTHAAFGEALQKAVESGVHVLAFDCLVEIDSIVLDQPVPVLLKEKENLRSSF